MDVVTVVEGWLVVFVVVDVGIVDGVVDDVVDDVFGVVGIGVVVEGVVIIGDTVVFFKVVAVLGEVPGDGIAVVVLLFGNSVEFDGVREITLFSDIGRVIPESMTNPYIIFFNR